MGAQQNFGARPRRASKFQPARHGLDEPPQHFTGPLTLANIYGEWWASARDGFFTVRWKRFYAYLHQFDHVSRAQMIAECETANRRRDQPHGNPAWED